MCGHFYVKENYGGAAVNEIQSYLCIYNYFDNNPKKS